MFLFQYGTISDEFENIKKSFQLVKTIHLSTHNDIFCGKKFILLPINDAKCPEEFIRYNEFVEKAFGCFDKFS